MSRTPAVERVLSERGSGTAVGGAHRARSRLRGVAVAGTRGRQGQAEDEGLRHHAQPGPGVQRSGRERQALQEQPGRRADRGRRHDRWHGADRLGRRLLRGLQLPRPRVRDGRQGEPPEQGRQEGEMRGGSLRGARAWRDDALVGGRRRPRPVRGPGPWNLRDQLRRRDAARVGLPPSGVEPGPRSGGQRGRDGPDRLHRRAVRLSVPAICSGSGNATTCALGTLRPGASEQRSRSASVRCPCPAYPTFNFGAGVTSSSFDPNPFNNGDAEAINCPR